MTRYPGALASSSPSELITTRDEASAYYAAKLARAHEITRYERRVTIVFEASATHLYSVEPSDGEAVASADRVERPLGRGRVEVRRFDLARARLMDRVLSALSGFTVSTSAQGGNRLVYGSRLADGQYMRVVLRPGPGEAWTCVSAYPVPEYKWKEARRSKAAKFPP